MATLQARLEALATRIANELRDAYKPRLVPTGGTTGHVLTKTSGGFAWQAGSGGGGGGPSIDLDNLVAGTTASAPGTGAFTPNAAATYCQPWSNVAPGVVLVKFIDGSDFEIRYCWWNGTNLSRPNALVYSSTGATLNLTDAAIAVLVNRADAPPPLAFAPPLRTWSATPASSAVNASGGIAAPTVISNSVGSAAIANTNFRTRQIRSQITSAVTANAQAGWHSTSVVAIKNAAQGGGGFRFNFRFAISTLPTASRFFIGLTSATMAAQVIEPSTRVGNIAAIGKDSTDTNLQVLVNDNSGSCDKTDTGIAPAADGVYRVNIWNDPLSSEFHFLLVRLDTAEIFYKKVSTGVPADGALLAINALAGLSAAGAVAMGFEPMGLTLQSGVD